MILVDTTHISVDEGKGNNEARYFTFRAKSKISDVFVFCFGGKLK